MSVTLRRWRRNDLEPLVRYANNVNIWRNLKDRFPHPYTVADGESWLERQENEPEPKTNFVIQFNGEFAGGIGLDRQSDVYRLTAEIGYWIAEPHWGKGLASYAVPELTDYAFRRFDFQRLQATVFAWNAASARVLEKSGYTLEAHLRNNIIKDGRIGDALIYARLRSV